MLTYLSPAEIIGHEGLRIVLVRGVPSPWCQAAKTIFEVKGLDYAAAALPLGTANEDLVAWSGENSSPIVAWATEKPIHRWIDILLLAERLAPEPALVPRDPLQRALMFGFSHEICGELGIGWNRRLQALSPMMDITEPPPLASSLGSKYRYNSPDAVAAGARIAESLRALTTQLQAQYARGAPYFVGDALSALDIYWTAFSILIDPLPDAQCPMQDMWRVGYTATDPQIREALDPLLMAHRDRIFQAHFRNPMDL